MRKKITSILLCIVLIITNISMNTYAANTKKVKISKTKMVFIVGNKKQLVLRNVKGKVTWKVKNSKIIKITKKHGKYKNKVTIKAKKKGRTKIVATYKKKKYVVRVKINSRKRVIKNKTQQNTVKIPTTSKDEKETMVEEQTTNKKLDLKEELKLEVTNSPIKLGDDMHMNVRISSVKGNHFITCYTFGKLEILKENGWQSVDIKDGFEIERLGNVSENNPFEFSIGINVDRGQCYVHIDNLVAGHYRYSHLAEWGSDVYLSDEFDIVE